MVAWDPTGLPYMFTQATGGKPDPALFELGSLNGCSGTLCLIPTVPASCGVVLDKTGDFYLVDLFGGGSRGGGGFSLAL